MGGNFASATAAWPEKTSPKEVMEFYKQSLPPKGWNESAFITTGDGGMGNYTSAKDPSLILNVMVSKADEGTEILVTVAKN